MRIYLTGATGGIGSAIKESLKNCEVRTDLSGEFNWFIFAHGIIDEEDASRTFAINTEFPICETKQYIHKLKHGVIFISSTSGIKGNTKLPFYSASKAALNSYCETMSRAHPELQFYSICPGPTDTKMWRSLNLPGKAQDPKEVAKAVRMAMEGAFQSGDIITVRDGIISV